MTGATLTLAAATADTPLRLELTLPPPDDHTAPDDDHRDGVRLTTAAATDLKDGPPRTLVIPLQIPPGDRPTLAVDVGTIVFADRSYDQQLAGAAKMDTRIELTTAGPRKWRLSADRFKYDLASTIYFAFGHIVESTGEFDALGGKWRLNITLLRGAGEIQLVISGVKNTGTVDRPEHGVDAGDAYAIPLGALLVVPGNAPAALRPDDKLRIRVTPGNGSGVSLPSPCEVTVEITAEPVITPAPSVFALIELLNAAAAVPLHAVAPTPTTIEFPDLPGDLALGSVRRNALFEWSWPRISGGGSKVSLLKIDRSGFGQIPDKNDAFKSLQKAPL
ncbi:hypothetical protein MPC1_6880003 [Methylocella tundrae]|nr:hypothetical protein MPC1_6880003 [Methylocella tundrae]